MIEWLEPELWLGKRQNYPRRQIYGKIEEGSVVEVSYQKKRWKARIISIGLGQRMKGKPPADHIAKAATSQHSEPSLADLLQKDREKVDELERAADKLDESYELSSEEEQSDKDEESEEEQQEGEQGREEGEAEVVEAGGSDKKMGTRWRKRGENRRQMLKCKWASGEEYVGYTGKKSEAKKVKVFPEVCCKKRKCSELFTAEEREEIFSHYYQLGSFERQIDFLLAHLRAEKPKREQIRSKSGERKRNRELTVKYILQKKTEDEELVAEDVQVCKEFFMGTLAIRHSIIETALRKSSSSGHCEEDDGRGQTAAHNKLSEDALKKIRKHIESFPVMESHYCRRDTRRKYFAADLSISKLYSLYKEQQEAAGSRVACLTSYKTIFGSEYNIGFYHPRKDQCQVCARYTAANGEGKEQLQEAYDQHIANKDLAQDSKKVAIAAAQAADPADTCVATFDLQSVLQLPSSDVSPFYYKRKICVYNLTVYECTIPYHGHCYLWCEVDGKRGSNEIGSCLLKYIRQLAPTVKTLVLFSDSCGGQNRNQFVAAAMLWAAQKSDLQEISLNFLESGHTQMECDAMHAAIEHEKRHKSVFGMNDWVNIMTAARRKKPYKVHRLSHKVAS